MREETIAKETKIKKEIEEKIEKLESDIITWAAVLNKQSPWFFVSTVSVLGIPDGGFLKCFALIGTLFFFAFLALKEFSVPKFRELRQEIRQEMEKDLGDADKKIREHSLDEVFTKQLSLLSIIKKAPLYTFATLFYAVSWVTVCVQ